MDDIKNAFILSSDILHRCNYFTSIEGLVVTHIIRDRLTYYLPRVLYVPLNLLIVAFECVLNLVSDYSTLSFTFMGLKKHQDFYNVGILVGRIAKDISMFYLEGWDQLI